MTYEEALVITWKDHEMTDEFTKDELATLVHAANESFRKTSLAGLIGKSTAETEGIIYTHIRTQLNYLGSSLAKKFGGQYKKLSCRLNLEERKQFQMICDQLTKRHLLDMEDDPGTIDGLKFTLASAEAAVKAATQAANLSAEIGEKLNKLEDELEQ